MTGCSSPIGLENHRGGLRARILRGEDQRLGQIVGAAAQKHRARLLPHRLLRALEAGEGSSPACRDSRRCRRARRNRAARNAGEARTTSSRLAEALFRARRNVVFISPSGCLESDGIPCFPPKRTARSFRTGVRGSRAGQGCQPVRRGIRGGDVEGVAGPACPASCPRRIRVGLPIDR